MMVAMTSGVHRKDVALHRYDQHDVTLIGGRERRDIRIVDYDPCGR